MNNRVYIAEEDKQLAATLEVALKRNGFFVRVFDSGYPIVEMMDNWPDVFLIDIELPDVNGLEVCKWLKSHDSSRHIPVIFISSDPYLKILAAPLHANDYVEKPFSFDDLLKKIINCLHIQRVDQD